MKGFLYLSFIFLFCSCALQSRKDQKEIRELYKSKKYKDGLSFLKKSEYKKDPNNYLLYLMEKGSFEYKLKNYKKSLKVFLEAIEFEETLYTKSIKEELVATVKDENKSQFRCRVVECSYLYNAAILSAFKLSKKDPKSVSKIRNLLQAWDSFFQTKIKEEKRLKDFQISSKLLSALMHEYLGTRNDLSSALILYENILVLDKKNEFAKIKVLELSKKIRPKKYRNYSRKIKLNKEAKLKLDEISAANTIIHLDYGLIYELENKNISLNLKNYIDKIESPTTKALIRGIGVPVLTYFMLGPLGLGTTSYYNKNTVVHTRHNIGEKLIEEVGIEFEMPHLENKKDKNEYFLELKSQQEFVTEKRLIPLVSFNELNQKSLEIYNDRVYENKSSRIALKYLTAIVAAYGTYTSLNRNPDNDFLAKTAAYSQFLVSQKAILKAEKADLRHWTTLPRNQLRAYLKLAKGKYHANLVKKKKDKKVSSIKLPTIEILDENKQTFFAHRVK